MADIIVDTYKLDTYAQRLAAVNRRINNLDHKINSLYTKVGLLGLWNLMQADALTGYSWKLKRCQSYLEQTATDFESTERHLENVDLTKFSEFVGISYSFINVGPGGRLDSLWDSIKEEISELPDDISSAGKTLAWVEEHYGKLPHWLTLGVDVVVPDSLKDAYILTSGILQGDLTLEEGWDVAKNVLSKNTKLAVICETLDYTFETGVARSEEMEKEIMAQLQEGDVVGAVLDGAEGFVDTIIGGSIEVIGDVTGTVVDDAIDNIPVVKGINMLTEYGTGLLGWNEGEGYSVGGLIGETTEIVSEGIDATTDFITDTANIVTDAVTQGVKSGIGWVKSWFN